MPHYCILRMLILYNVIAFFTFFVLCTHKADVTTDPRWDGSPVNLIRKRGLKEGINRQAAVFIHLYPF